jgi:hypothetical protein
MTNTSRWWRFAAALGLGLALTACGTANGGEATGSLSVSVAEPESGTMVTVPFTVRIDSSVPLGPSESGQHHVHVWFDGQENDYLIVESETVEITDLPAGAHTMHVSLRNANHSAAGAETEIPITVGDAGGGGSTPASDAPTSDAPDYPGY